MLASSSLTKVAVHICKRRRMHSGKSQQRQTILWGDSRRCTYSFAPHACINVMPIFLDRTGRLHLCFCCGHALTRIAKTTNNPPGSLSYMRKSSLQPNQLNEKTTKRNAQRHWFSSERHHFISVINGFSVKFELWN